MPTYEYRCNACSGEFEYQQKMSDPDLVTCEACGADKLEKLISWTAFQFAGWEKALYQPNAKDAIRGMVDHGKPPPQKKPDAATTAPTETAASAATTAVVSPAAPPAAGPDATTDDDPDKTA